jgi:hypothetical protein
MYELMMQETFSGLFYCDSKLTATEPGIKNKTKQKNKNKTKKNNINKNKTNKQTKK